MNVCVAGCPSLSDMVSYDMVFLCGDVMRVCLYVVTYDAVNDMVERCFCFFSFSCISYGREWCRKYRFNRVAV